MNLLTSIYYYFWFGLWPLCYWPGATDYEFPKFIILITAVNVWGIIVTWRFGIKWLRLSNRLNKMVVLYGVATTISWLVNGMSADGLIGDQYRYMGLITIWSMIEWYFISRIVFEDGIDKINIILSWWVILIIGTVYPMMGNNIFLAYYVSVLGLMINKWWSMMGSVGMAGYLDSRGAMIVPLITMLDIKANKISKIIIGVLVVVLMLTIMPKKEWSHFDNRLVIWEKSAQVVAKSPIFGWGPERFDSGFQLVLKENDFDLKNVRVDRAHNIIIDVWMSSGIIGLCLWLAIVGITLKHSKYWLAMAGWLILASVNVVSLNNWLLFFLLISTTKDARSSSSA